MNKLLKKNENIYIFLLIIFIFSIILQNDFVKGDFLPDYIYSLTRYSVSFICALKVLFYDIKKYSYNSKILLFLILLIILISSIKSGNRVLLQLFPISLASFEMDYKKIFKYVLLSEGLILFCIVICSIIGVVPNLIFYRSDSNSVIRYALGFKYTTFISIAIFSLTLIYLYLKKEKINIIDVFLLIFINVALFFATNSRAELLCSVISILLFYFYRIFNNKHIKNFLDFFTKYLMIILIFISFVFSLMFNVKNSLHQKIDNIFSKRLYYWNDAIKDYDVTLFGNKIEYFDISNISQKNNSKSYLIDNSYIDIYISGGIFILIIVVFAFYKLSTYSIKSRDIFLQIVLVVTYVHSFINPDLLMIKYNLFLIFLFAILIDKKKTKTDISEQMDITQIHELQVEMLRKTTSFLEKNKLNYYLCGGTLLGAIRHNGFIPWDDDVDILMPRDDYEKLIDIAKIDKISNNLIISSFKNNTSDLPFIKVFNTDYLVEETYIEVKGGEYLWIDIFPMDGLYENSTKNVKLYKKISFYRKLLSIRLLKKELIVKSSRNIVKIIFKPIIKFFIDLLPIKFYSKKIDKISKTCPFSTSKYVGGVMWGYGPQERLERKKVLKKVKVEFEGMKLYTFSCWDEYLKNLYGNYMKLPPKEKQTTHLISIVKAGSHE